MTAGASSQREISGCRAGFTAVENVGVSTILTLERRRDGNRKASLIQMKYGRRNNEGTTMNRLRRMPDSLFFSAEFFLP
jgi:hypothetical protein